MIVNKPRNVRDVNGYRQAARNKEVYLRCKWYSRKLWDAWRDSHKVQSSNGYNTYIHSRNSLLPRAVQTADTFFSFCAKMTTLLLLLLLSFVATASSQGCGVYTDKAKFQAALSKAANLNTFDFNIPQPYTPLLPGDVSVGVPVDLSQLIAQAAQGLSFLGKNQVVYVGGDVKDNTTFHSTDGTAALGIQYDVFIPLTMVFAGTQAVGFDYFMGTKSPAAMGLSIGSTVQTIPMTAGKASFFGVILCEVVSSLVIVPKSRAPVYLTIDNIISTPQACGAGSTGFMSKCGCGKADTDCSAGAAAGSETIYQFIGNIIGGFLGSGNTTAAGCTLFCGGK